MNLALSIYIFFAIIIVMVSFLSGLYNGNIISGLLRLFAQIVWVIIICILLYFIQQIQYGDIIVWIIVLLAILVSIAEIINSLNIF